MKYAPEVFGALAIAALVIVFGPVGCEGDTTVNGDCNILGEVPGEGGAINLDCPEGLPFDPIDIDTLTARETRRSSEAAQDVAGDFTP